MADVVLGNRFTRYFRRLRWKLTASYTFVTVAVLLVLELLAILAISTVLIILLRGHSDVILDEVEQETSLALADDVASDTPNLEGVHGWLTDIRQNGIHSRQGDVGVHVSAQDLNEPGTQLLVVDRDGRVLGRLGQGQPPTRLEPLDVASIPDLAEILPDARAGEPNATPFIDWPLPDHITAAVPIRSPTGEVRGFVVYTGPYLLLQEPLRGLAAAIVASAVVFTIAAGFIGTFFGYFTARGLTRRLNRMSSAATSWGGGDFSNAIKDSSPDEIGQLARQLNRMSEQLQGLIEARQQLSVVDERNRLARDLHDSVKQQAFAISMNLGAAQSLWERDPATARARLDSAFELSRQSQQELSAIIQTLRPIELEQGGLRQALPQFVTRWQAQYGIEARCEVSGEAELARDVEDALYRIAQEALANTARHSKATLALIRASLGPDAAELTVRDNGQGFDLRRARSGVGMHSMRERVEALGGTFTIESGGSGTSLVARIPLAPTEGDQP